MSFLKQTLALTASGLRGIPQRRGSSLVTVIGVTTVVGVLISLLSIRDGATIFTGGNSPKDQVVVLSRGANGSPQSSLPREAVPIIESAPGVKHTPDGRPYSVFTSMVPVDAIKKDGKRGNVFLVGFTPGTALVQSPVKLVAGRMYKPAVHEVLVSEPIHKMYKN